jgi:hypothetical protein
MRGAAGSHDMPVHMYKLHGITFLKVVIFKIKSNKNEKNYVLTTVTMNIFAF